MANQKKAVVSAQSNMQFGNWAFLLGILVALIGVFVRLPFAEPVLVVLGVVGGYLLIHEKDSVQYIAYAFGAWIIIQTISNLSPLFIFENLAVFLRNVLIMLSGAVLVVVLRALGKAAGVLK